MKGFIRVNEKAKILDQLNKIFKNRNKIKIKIKIK